MAEGGGVGTGDTGRSPPPDRRLQRPPRPAPPRRPASTGNFTTLLAHSRAETHGPGSSPCLAPLRGVGEGRGGEGARPALHRPGSGSSSFAEWLPMFGRLRWPRAGRPRTEWLPCRAAARAAPASEAVADAGPLQSKKEPSAFQFPAAREPLLAPAGEPRPLICIHHALWVSSYPPRATPPTSSASCLIDPAHHPPERLVVCQARPSPPGLLSVCLGWPAPSHLHPAARPPQLLAVCQEGHAPLSAYRSKCPKPLPALCRMTDFRPLSTRPRGELQLDKVGWKNPTVEG